MGLTFVLLSPTFGMHQYTADLANRVAGTGSWKLEAGDSDDQATSLRQPASSNQLPATSFQQPAARLVTTSTFPRDRYSSAVEICTPVTIHGTGFSREGLSIAAYHRVSAMCKEHPTSHIPHPTSDIPHSTFHIPHPTFDIPHPTSHIPHPTSDIPHSTFHIVHFTGVHLWNVPLVYALRRRGVPVIHTLHDLEPHAGVRFGPLIRLWNRWIIGSGCHLLVHGRRYRDELLSRGVPSERVTCVPLLHGFLGADRPWPPVRTEMQRGGGAEERGSAGDPAHSGGNLDRKPTVLFFGRVEAYKGADVLLAAWARIAGEMPAPRLAIAGPHAADVRLPPLPPGVELRDRRISDAEGDALFRSAGLLVLPYRDATQSALVAAAYAYGLPVIVTDSGALPEYVVDGETGWIVPPGDAPALAGALREALRDPEALRRMGAAGRTWFEARRREEEAALSGMYASVLANSAPF